MVHVVKGILTREVGQVMNRDSEEQIRSIASRKLHLMLQRSHMARYPLLWEYPGGKVSATREGVPETFLDTLRRELKEETGIILLNAKYRNQVLRNISHIEYIFEVTDWTPEANIEVNPTDHCGYGWFDTRVCNLLLAGWDSVDLEGDI
jgi:8-oxo-dGTP pyrophosphatase MutT (NUDIX family)